MSDTRVGEKSVSGLVFEVSSSEFADRLKKRSEYHTMRANTKEKESLPQLLKVLEDIDSKAAAAGGKFSNYSHNPKDAVDQLKEDIRTHRTKAQRLSFLAAHVITGRSYYLSLSDIDQLEITYN